MLNPAPALRAARRVELLLTLLFRLLPARYVPLSSYLILRNRHRVVLHSSELQIPSSGLACGSAEDSRFAMRDDADVTGERDLGNNSRRIEV